MKRPNPSFHGSTSTAPPGGDDSRRRVAVDAYRLNLSPDWALPPDARPVAAIHRRTDVRARIPTGAACSWYAAAVSDPVLRARHALASLRVDPVSPLGPALARARRWAGAPVPSGDLLDGWWARQPGGFTSATRYRWDTSHKHCAVPPWAGSVETWRAWHPLEQSDL